MMLHKYKAVILSLFILFSFVVPNLAQKNEGQGTTSQRLEVMRQKMETKAVRHHNYFFALRAWRQ